MRSEERRFDGVLADFPCQWKEMMPEVQAGGGRGRSSNSLWGGRDRAALDHWDLSVSCPSFPPVSAGKKCFPIAPQL